MDNWKELKVSEGEEILSLNDISKRGISAPCNEKNSQYTANEIKKNSFQNNENQSNFNDIEEISTPEIVNIYSQEQKSKIQSIEWSNKEAFFPKLFDTISNKTNIIENSNGTISVVDEGKVIEKSIKPVVKKYKVTEFKSKSEENQNNEEIKEIEDNKEEALVQEEIQEENVEELEELQEEIDDNEYLTSLIQGDQVKYPGKIDLTKIEKGLCSKEIKISEDEIPLEQEITGEMFGVKRAEVFYQIDKQIYSNRQAKSLDISRIKNLKSGIFLPLLVVIISFTTLLLVQPLLYFYFQKSAKASLEENVIKDSSILAKIAKQKEEEAKRAQQRLEEERKRLEYEKSRIENTINEELAKKQADIESQFKQKYAELEKKGLNEKEMEKMRKQLEEEKALALQKAEEEKNRKIQEQQKILEEKNKEIKEAEDKLKKALENKEYEIANITKSMQEQIKAKEKEREEISRRLKELNEINQKIREFNDIVYQLISGAIDEFKNNNIEQGLVKLNTVLKYYEGRLDFVMSNPDLKNKMQTDIFFVQTISKLVQDAKSSALYNKEFVNIVNKFKRITEFYKNAENYYTQKDFKKSSEEYTKVLSEFDEVNFSYNRLKEIEKQIQNLRALDSYNKAIDSMKNNRYGMAISQFISVVRENPSSDYALVALNSIAELTSKLLPENIIAEANRNAKPIFDMANKSYEEKKYDEAIALYDSIIAKYPMSDYIKQAYTNIVAINNIKSKGDAGIFENRLRENFRKEYQKFVEAYKKGNFNEAREYYFSALNNAFASYTDDSIINFKKEEDKYIASLSTMSDKNLQALLDRTKKEVEDEFNKRIEEQKKSYESEIARIKLDFENRINDLTKERDQLKNDYVALKNASSSKEEIEAIKKSYDEQIVKKDKEIQEAKKLYNESLKYIETLKKEIEDSKKTLIAERENIIKEKEKEIEDLKKGNKEARDYAEQVKKNIEEEKDKLIKEKDALILAKTEELENLKTQYNQLTERYNKLSSELQVDKSKLIAEKDKLFSENTMLIKERDSLKAENKSLTDEIASLKKERENIIKNYSEMSKSDIEKERSQFIQEKNRLENENKALLAQIESLKSEKDSIIKEYTEKLKNASTTKNVNEITAKYEAMLSQKDKEIEQLKTNYSTLLNEGNNLKSENTNLKNELAQLREERDKLVKEYTDKMKDAASGKELMELKKKYDSIIAEKDKEIESLKSQLATTTITDENQLREELAKKEVELKNEKENNAKLKEQLVESYKKYTELERLNMIQNEKIQENYKKDLSELQKRYKELEDSYNKYKDEQPAKYKEIENRIRKEMDQKLSEEKQKIINQFMSEIERLNSIIDAEEKLKNEKQRMESISQKDKTSKDSSSSIYITDTKYFARVTTISGNSVSFQFFTTDFINYVKKGDEIQIVRVSNVNNTRTETLVGKMEISNISNNSLFGMGRIIYFENNNVVKTGDLLRK
ncbi:MAG TPA: hypothetical protein PK351_05555 [Spirochaetota bacterium]|nr:hypothetical protein [Spirochaetota bacterium]